MNDLLFDIITREIILDGQLFDGQQDFVTTTNPSVQNGGICLYGRAINLLFPMFGIGMEEVMGANLTKVTYEMNRWKSQVKNDGATLGTWKSTITPGDQGDAIIESDISYL